MKKNLIASLLTLIIFGCATTSLTTSEADFQKHDHRWAGYTFSEYTQGQELYFGSCGKCHQLYKPAEFSEQEWTSILPKMIDRAKLGSIEKEMIFRYLITEKESGSNADKPQP